MSRNMLQLVKETLREDDRLSSDGKLLKNKIMELTHKQDEELIDLLLSNDRLKEHFFTEVNGTLVFDKDEFIKFVNNKQFLPDSYTTFKNKIGLTSDDDHLFHNRHRLCFSFITNIFDNISVSQPPTYMGDLTNHFISIESFPISYLPRGFSPFNQVRQYRLLIQQRPSPKGL